MSRYVLTIPAKQDLKEINRYIIRYNPDAARRLNDKNQTAV
ncbi:MAG: type II toxin-antitoxin system RelE/ParE family toxin [Nostoc sp.]